MWQLGGGIVGPVHRLRERVDFWPFISKLSADEAGEVALKPGEEQRQVDGG